jgi:glycosyltransferase involved in cell wall biosynthesis
MLVYYATVFDSKNIHSWSGLGYYIGKMLENEGITVRYLNDLPIKYKVVHKLKKRLLKDIFNEGYSLNFNEDVAQQYAKLIEQRVPKGSIIFSPNTVILANLDRSYKKVLFTDATFERLLNFYPAYMNIKPERIQKAQEIERRALETSNLLIYTSEWASKSAVSHYHADAAKITIVPFGANVDINISEQALSSAIKQRLNRKEIRLVLAGVSWFRKGGDYAVEVLNHLNKAGIKAKLHLVGFKKIPSSVNMNHIVNHGFISKATPDGQRKFAEILQDSDFLLLPSRADCTPVVVLEANSFGLPCLISNVGGNYTMVENNNNGFIFDFSKGPDACADYIMSLQNSPEEYSQLCLSSYNRYLTTYNWQATGKKIKQLLHALQNNPN